MTKPIKPLRIQVNIEAPVSRVYGALTESEALQSWFAESADVSVADGRYDFWGRYTPECPSRESGRHVVTEVEPERRLGFQWPLRGADTTVTVRMKAHDAGTTLGLWHHDVPNVPHGAAGGYAFEDVWFLSLENLRRYLRGQSAIRCDFSAMGSGDLQHSIEIDGSAEAVWDALVRPDQLNRWIASNAKVDMREGGVWDLGWGDMGALPVVSLEPQRSFSLAWEEEKGKPTVVTWTLEKSGGKTRLTIVHSGFGDDRHDGVFAGWLNFMSWIKSMVEIGATWAPAFKPITAAVAMYYAASIWEQQDEMLEDDDDAWA